MGRQISIEVRDPDGSAVEDQLFEAAEGLVKDSQYPGGLYGPAKFFIPRAVGERPSRLQAGQSITIRLYTEDFWALDNIYEGKVNSLEEVKRGGKSYTSVGLIGAWGWYMETDGLERNWADTRLSANAWEPDTAAAGAEKAFVDRQDRLRITPKGVAWTNGQQFVLVYQTPTGELVGKVENSYDMQESGQAWELALHNGVADEWSVTSSGNGTQNVDLGTFICQLYLEAKAGQTPIEDGTYYGEVSSLIVYASRDHAAATLGTVNVYEIALDIVDRLGVDVTLISANIASLDSTLTLSLVPFITRGWETYASILARAASYGTSVPRNPVGYGLLPSFLAPDNKPLLFIEKYPTLTDYDFEISVDECDLSVRLNVEEVWNWIVVEYTDAEGNTATLTPDDDADLTDADSVEQYGERRRKIELSLANTAQAKNFGTRYLARHKQPTYAVTRPVVVARLLAKNGAWVPAPLINAGKRLRIVDLPNLTGQDNVGGTTFMITYASYDHDRGTVSLSLGGRPDNLTVWLAQMELATA